MSIRVLRIIGGERKVGAGRRPGAAADQPEGGAGAEDVAIVGDQQRIAAVDAGDVDRLAADEIEDARIGRDEDRIAELLDARRAVLVGDVDREFERLDRLPAHAVAERAQRAEVGEMLDLEIEVERDVADLAEEALAPAGERQIEAAERRGAVAAEVAQLGHAGRAASRFRGRSCCRRRVTLAMTGPPGRLSGEPLNTICASPERLVDSARSSGASTSRLVADRRERIERRIAGREPRLDRRRIGVGVGPRDGARDVVIGGEGPAPGLDVAVERQPAMAGPPARLRGAAGRRRRHSGTG